MPISHLLQQITSEQGWPVASDPNGDYRLEIPTEPCRSQVVTVSTGHDPDGKLLVYFWSRITDVSNVADPWYLLRLNVDLHYGALAVRGSDVILVETQLAETADQEEVARALYFVATKADALEKQVHGHQDTN